MSRYPIAFAGVYIVIAVCYFATALMVGANGLPWLAALLWTLTALAVAMTDLMLTLYTITRKKKILSHKGRHGSR